MADCFIRVCKNWASIQAAAIVEIIFCTLAVYLADEILTIAKYIHTTKSASCDSFGF